MSRFKLWSGREVMVQEEDLFVALKKTTECIFATGGQLAVRLCRYDDPKTDVHKDVLIYDPNGL